VKTIKSNQFFSKQSRYRIFSAINLFHEEKAAPNQSLSMKFALLMLLALAVAYSIVTVNAAGNSYESGYDGDTDRKRDNLIQVTENNSYNCKNEGELRGLAHLPQKNFRAIKKHSPEQPNAMDPSVDEYCKNLCQRMGRFWVHGWASTLITCCCARN
jgi:hypothetical protein